MHLTTERTGTGPVREIGRWSWWERPLLLWEHPISSTLLALAVYTAFAAGHGNIRAASLFAYFNYLADAFLHGQLALRLLPAPLQDLSLFQGRYYLYWSPFPAVLLLPFVSIFGVGFSDIIFTLGVGALNVGLVSLLLRQACRRSVIQLSSVQRGLLVLFFALGTVHVTLAPYGRVWFTGQLVGFLCVVSAYLAALSLSAWPAFVLTGMAVAAALLTRNHLVFTGLWPAWYLFQRYRHVEHRHLFGYVVAGIVPVALAVGLLGYYNWLRFDTLFDNGLAYHAMEPVFKQNFQRYGAFNLQYVPTNAFYQYVAYPLPLRDGSFQGGSLFLMSPVFFAAFWGIVRGRRQWSAWILVATIVLVAIPILLLMGTGWVQWGPRYTLDFTVPLLLLTALGLRRWPLWVIFVLTLLSIAHYLRGTLHFMWYL